MVAAVPGFPYRARPDGSCEKLIDNRCSVYETRPAACRIDETADRLKIDRRAFHERNAAICNAMIKEAGLPDRFLVNLPAA